MKQRIFIILAISLLSTSFLMIVAASAQAFVSPGTGTKIIDATGVGCTELGWEWHNDSKTCYMKSDLSSPASPSTDHLWLRGASLDGFYQPPGTVAPGAEAGAYHKIFGSGNGDQNAICTEGGSVSHIEFVGIGGLAVYGNGNIKNNIFRGSGIYSADDGNGGCPGCRIEHNTFLGGTNGVAIQTGGDNLLIAHNSLHFGATMELYGLTNSIVEHNSLFQGKISISEGGYNIDYGSECPPWGCFESVVLSSYNDTVRNNYIFSSATWSYELNRCHGCSVTSSLTARGISGGIHISNSNGASASGNTVSDTATGIKVTSSPNVDISNNVIVGNTTGVNVDPSDNATITGNSFSNNSDAGLIIDSSGFAAVHGNNFNQNGTGEAARVIGSSAGNDFTGNYWDAYLGVGPYIFSGGQDDQPLLSPAGDCQKPDLRIGKDNVYWGSYADFMDRKLSITYMITNHGVGTAYAVKYIDSWPSDSLILLSTVPVDLGSIPGGGSAPVTVEYSVPVGVLSFYTLNYAEAYDECGFFYAYHPDWR